MISRQSPAALQKASTPIQTRLRLDREKASRRVEPLVAYLETHLFDPSLTVKKMCAACRVRDNNLLSRFRREMGRTPHLYLTHARMEVAAELLLLPGLQIWKIAQWVGYRSLASFSRTFLRWSGQRPGAYRRRLGARRGEQESDPRPAAGSPNPKKKAPKWRLHRGQEGAGPSDPARPSRYGFERAVALRLYERLRRHSCELELEAVARRIRFATPALAELLLAKSRQEGRRDRRLGVILARLAVDILAAPRFERTDRWMNLEGRALVGLGNAQRLAMDYRGAEKSFRRVERSLAAVAHVEVAVQGELLHCRAALEWSRREYGRALELVDSALPLLRVSADPKLLAQVLILRSNCIRYTAGPQAAAPDLGEARVYLGEESGDYLFYPYFTSLIRLHLLAGAPAAANEALARARRHADRFQNPGFRAYLLWFEARIEQEKGRISEAMRLYDRAQRALLELENLPAAAAVGIDWAVLNALCGRRARVVELVSEAILVFEVLGVAPDTLRALELLYRALEGGERAAALAGPLRRLSTEHLCRF